MRMDETENQETLELPGSQPEQDTDQQSQVLSANEDIEVSFVLGYN